MKMPTLFSRLFAASGTGLTARFRQNLYVRTTVTIILLQVLLASLVIFAFGTALRTQQEQTIATISQNLTDSVQSVIVGTPPPEGLALSLKTIHDETQRYTLLGIILLTVFFGYLTARFALGPVRNSLTFQREFIGNMAHEVRTPLAIIKTNTEVALMDPKISTDVRDTFTTTLHELDRISETINSLLSFNALIQPNRALFSPINISEIAENVVERHRELADSRGVSLSFTSSEPHFILGNQNGIDQVITNLVKNAIHYTPQHEEGAVTVTIHPTRGHVVLTVADNGIGIARNNLHYIFQPYFRVDTARVRGVSGGTSGLGLAIVNEIVKQHKGKIAVKSALGRGTIIDVSFPKTAEETAAEEEGDVEEVELELA